MKRVVLAAVFVACATPAFAYRPFNSTDASVAARHELEIELGPLGLVTGEADRTLIVPATIFNIGRVEGWELVIDGRGFVPLRDPRSRRWCGIDDTAISVKHLIRRGLAG